MKERKTPSFTLDHIAFGILLGAMFLIPVFFIPITGISLDFAKGTILSLAVSIAFLLWLIARLRQGEIAIPQSSILLSGTVMIFVFFLSALFSPAVRVSLFGLGNEIGTFAALLTLFVFLVLSAFLFQSHKRIFYSYIAFVIGTFIIALFQILRLVFGADFLSLGVFFGSTANMVGRWNDMSLFFGLAAVFSIVTLQMLSLRGLSRILLYLLLALSLFFLALTNFSTSWILVGGLSLLVFVYSIFFGMQPKKPSTGVHLATTPLVVVILSILFLIPGNIGGFLSTQFNIAHVEVRPSWSATFDIAKKTLANSPVLGSGPNRFAPEWLMHKPAAVNQTFFWNTDFNFGIGIIPSLAVTTGILGILAVLVFLGLFAYRGIGVLFVRREDIMSQYLATSSFLLALYLWTSAVFYVPNIVLLSLAVFFTGAWIGLMAKDGIIKTRTFSFVKDPRLGFVSVLVLIVFIILATVGVYFFAQRALAVYSFNKGLASFNIDGDIGKAQERINRAISLYRHDTFYRALSEAYIAQMSSTLSGSSADADTIRAQFQNMLGSAIDSARRAIDFDDTNYLNWLSLGRVYESVIPLNIEGAYENAVASYEKARALNPNSPALYLTLARVDLAQGDKDGARARIEKALALKNDYTEAIFLLSQIAAQSGDINEAITQAERASFIAPNDIGVFFQLGLLRYQDKNYNGAISALERAVVLNPVYANAKYFLGLSYYNAGRTNDALAQFEDIAILNPDNAEVRQIIANLKNGNRPFASVVPPAEPPEERDEPPVEEQ